jgi:hypothetical protein
MLPLTTIARPGTPQAGKPGLAKRRKGPGAQVRGRPRRTPGWRRSDRANNGFLGLLVFSATALTGTAMFALMMETTTDLGQEAQGAVAGATADVLPGLQVRSLGAQRLPGADLLATLEADLVVAPGAGRLNLTTLVVEVVAPTGRAAFRAHGTPSFTWVAYLDAEPRLDPDQPVLSRGDLVRLTFPVHQANLTLGPRAEGTLRFHIPDAREERTTFVVPSTFAGKDVLELHRGSPPPRPGPSASAWTLERMGPWQGP